MKSLMENVYIQLDYEYECGGHAYSRTVLIPKNEFESDTLLILVCAYMQSACGGYPGTDIDLYLHNRFPDVHTDEAMLGSCCFNVYNCIVDGLADFYSIAKGLFGIDDMHAKDYLSNECMKYNNEHAAEQYSDFQFGND